MSQVIKLHTTDVGLARELFQYFHSGEGNKTPLEVSDGYIEGILSRKDFHVLAAVEDQKLLGGLTAYELMRYKSERTDIFLYDIAVKPEHRQHGIGRMLLEELKKLCKDKGIQHTFVITQRFNIAALELFKDLGGQPDMDSIMFTFDLD